MIQEIVETSLDGAENAIVCPAVGTELGYKNVKSAVKASGTNHFLKFDPFAGSSDNVNAPVAGARVIEPEVAFANARVPTTLPAVPRVGVAVPSHAPDASTPRARVPEQFAPFAARAVAVATLPAVVARVPDVGRVTPVVPVAVRVMP